MAGGFFSRNRRTIIGGAVGLAAVAAVIIPTTASSAPGPGPGATKFVGFVNPGWTTTTCANHAQAGNGFTLTTVRVGITKGTDANLGGAKKIKVSFAGNIYPPVVLSAANQWEYTYPAGASVPCKRIRSIVTFQPLRPNNTNVGTADTDTLGYAVCASPCLSIT